MNNVPNMDERIHQVAHEVYAAPTLNDISDATRCAVLSLVELLPSLSAAHRIAVRDLYVHIEGQESLPDEQWDSITKEVLDGGTDSIPSILAATARHQLRDVVMENVEMQILTTSRAVFSESNSPYERCVAAKYICGYSSDASEVMRCLSEYMQDPQNPTQQSVHKIFYYLVEAAVANGAIDLDTRMEIAKLITDDMMKSGPNTMPDAPRIHYYQGYSLIAAQYWAAIDHKYEEYVISENQQGREPDEEQMDSFGVLQDECIRILQRNIIALELTKGASRFAAGSVCYLSQIHLCNGEVNAAKQLLQRARNLTNDVAQRGGETRWLYAKIEELDREIAKERMMGDEIDDDDSEY